MLILGAGALIAAGVFTMRLRTPQKVSAQGGCSIADAVGSYGFQFAGSVQSAPQGPFVAFAETGKWNVESSGRITGVSKFSFGGTYFDHTFEGTVQINPDCTGSSVVPKDRISDSPI